MSSLASCEGFINICACFPSEPLYQTYRATVITKEIRRQTVCRNISKTSADYAMDWTPRRNGTGSQAAAGNGGPKGSPVPPSGQSTLWQEVPAVRDSGVLEGLTPEQCKYQEVRREKLMYAGEFHQEKSIMLKGEMRDEGSILNHI